MYEIFDMVFTYVEQELTIHLDGILCKKS